MIDQIVRHSRYGQGIITDYKPPYMKVRFEQRNVEKRFAYPMAFESFLRFENSEYQSRASAEIDAIRAEEAQRAARQAEAMRAREAEMLEAHKAEVKARRTAAAKKAAGTRAASGRTTKSKSKQQEENT